MVMVACFNEKSFKRRFATDHLFKINHCDVYSGSLGR